MPFFETLLKAKGGALVGGVIGMAFGGPVLSVVFAKVGAVIAGGSPLSLIPGADALAGMADGVDLGSVASEVASIDASGLEPTGWVASDVASHADAASGVDADRDIWGNERGSNGHGGSGHVNGQGNPDDWNIHQNRPGNVHGPF